MTGPGDGRPVDGTGGAGPARNPRAGGAAAGDGRPVDGTGGAGPARNPRAGGAAAGGGLLVVGEVVTDVVARHRTPLAYGTDTTARIRTLPGGAGANVACWAAWSGCPDVRLLARAGVESAGWHREALERAGVRALLAVDDEARPRP